MRLLSLSTIALQESGLLVPSSFSYIVCLELVIPSVVYSVWTQMVRVGGVFMEGFVVESLTFALYQMGWTLAI